MNTFALRSSLLAAAMLFLAAAPFASAQQPNPIPHDFRTIYPQPSEAASQVDQAIQLAAQQNKRILLDFGTNDCPDCQALEKRLQEDPNHAQIAEHFLLVHINIGKDHKQNLDLAQRFGIPIGQGIPAISVIDGQGHVIHAQTHGEFRHAHNLSSDDILTFLNKWRG